MIAAATGLKSDIASAGRAVKHPIKRRNKKKSTTKRVIIDREGLNGSFRGNRRALSIGYLKMICTANEKGYRKKGSFY
jgi:hypothetical protein